MLTRWLKYKADTNNTPIKYTRDNINEMHDHLTFNLLLNDFGKKKYETTRPQKKKVQFS